MMRDPAPTSAPDHVSLRTYRADGSSTTCPVWAAGSAERMVVRTFARTRKARRLAARPHVEVAACTRDGLPLEAYRGAAASALRGRHAWRAQWLLLRRRGAVLVAADLVYRVRLGPRRWYLLEVEGV